MADTAAPAATAPDAKVAEDDLANAQMFDLSLKKKKKKKAVKSTEAEAGSTTKAAAAASGAPASAASAVGDIPVHDYSYDQLLTLVYDQLRAHNPALAERKKYVMKPPQVVRIGSKKSAWINFQEICNLMHRNAEHVMQFFLAELGTDGSIAGGQQLVLKGRYTPKQVESLLRKYITEYVTCHMCKNPDTTLSRDSVSRLYFIHCEACNSSRSVAPIKAGFHAVSKQDRQRQKLATK